MSRMRTQSSHNSLVAPTRHATTNCRGSCPTNHYAVVRGVGTSRNVSLTIQTVLHTPSTYISNPSCPDFPVASGKGASLVAIKARRAELNRNVGSRILCFDTRCHRFVVSRCEDQGWGEAPDGSESVRTYFERVRFLPATSYL